MARHPRLAVPVGPEDHVLGSPEAPITLVMYGDYTCPYTQRASAFVDVARRKLGRRMRYVFRHFPREELHPEAGLLAEAAHAAGSQDRFWEMNETVGPRGPRGGRRAPQRRDRNAHAVHQRKATRGDLGGRLSPPGSGWRTGDGPLGASLSAVLPLEPRSGH